MNSEIVLTPAQKYLYKLRKKLSVDNVKEAFIKSLKNIFSNKNILSQENINNSTVFNSSKINDLDENGLAALHYAVLFNNYNIVRLLINSGADINIRPEDKCEIQIITRRINRIFYKIIDENFTPIYLLIQSIHPCYLEYKSSNKSENDIINNIIEIINLLLPISNTNVIEVLKSYLDLETNKNDKIFDAIFNFINPNIYSNSSKGITISLLGIDKEITWLNYLIKIIFENVYYHGMEKLIEKGAFKNFNEDLTTITLLYLLYRSETDKTYNIFKEIVNIHSKNGKINNNVKKFFLDILKKVNYTIKITSWSSEEYPYSDFYVKIRSLLYTKLAISSTNQRKIYYSTLGFNYNKINIHSNKILQKYYPNELTTTSSN